MSEVDPAGVASIGRRLKEAREAKGIGLDEVATQTRIPIRHLHHIEEGNWEALPATTYSVGFARAYANAVGLNGNEIGVELRQQLGATRASYDAPAALYEPADPARVPPRSLAIVALLIGIALVIGYFVFRNMNVGDDVDPAAPPPVAEAPVQPAQQAAQPQPQPATATGPVVLTATDEVWLRIDEADGGAALFQGVLQAGQTFQVPATARAPQIRTGRPQALTVTVGSTRIPPLGQPEQTIDDVSLLAADLVARAGGAAGPAPGQPTLPQPSQPVPGPAAPAAR